MTSTRDLLTPRAERLKRRRLVFEDEDDESEYAVSDRIIDSMPVDESMFVHFVQKCY